MIKVLNTVDEMHEYSRKRRIEGRRIGLVPTMGFLHSGHLSLVRKAKELSDIVVVSVFVNPTQFSPNEDLDKYPRDFVRDRKLLMDEGVDAIFYPKAEEIYTKDFQTYVDVTGKTKLFEGESRPTHFKGVTTIVSILFNSVMPDVAVFGQKDAQQAAVIKQMVKDLKFAVMIEVAPIVREKDGLAMSSRNVYLSPEERKDALVLNRSLNYAKSIIDKGEIKTLTIISEMKKIIEEAKSSDLEYIKIVNSDSFEEVDELVPNEKYYILIACYIGKTRLIDNILI